MGNILTRSPTKYLITRRKPEEYDWIPDLSDSRDVHYIHPRMIKIKNGVCLNPVFVSGKGCSVANSIISVYSYEYNKNLEEDMIFDSSFLSDIQSLIYDCRSQQMLYSIRDGLKLLATIGTGVSEERGAIKTIGYKYVKPDIRDLQLALCFDHPVLFGMSVYESQVNAENDFPAPSGRLLGGTCCIIRGYETNRACFLIQGLGKKEIWIPFKRILEEGSCFWIMSHTRVTSVTEEYSFREV